MKGHTLMQTIARANRVFENKECGLIIDHINVFKHLKRALADYASNDNIDMPVKNIDDLFGKLNESIDMTCAFCKSHNAELKTIIDEATDPWGIRVNRVELKNIMPPKAIQESMEKQMKAERERRETILVAEGEKKAAVLRAEAEKESRKKTTNTGEMPQSKKEKEL